MTSTITITIEHLGRGLYRALGPDGRELVARSREPLLAAARTLLATGADAETRPSRCAEWAALRRTHGAVWRPSLASQSPRVTTRLRASFATGRTRAPQPRVTSPTPPRMKQRDTQQIKTTSSRLESYPREGLALLPTTSWSVL